MRSRQKRQQDREAKKARRRHRIATGKRPRRRDMQEVADEGAMRFRTELMKPIEDQSRKREKQHNKDRAQRQASREKGWLARK